MTPQETDQVLAILYSIWRTNETPEDLERESQIWHWTFQSDPFPVVQKGVQMWIKGGNAFMPKPAQLREMIVKSQIRLIPDEEWSLVRKALGMHTRGLRHTTVTIGPRDQALTVPPPSFHPLTQRTIDALGEPFMRENPEIEVRKAFIYTLRTIIDSEIDRLTYGDDPLSLDIYKALPDVNEPFMPQLIQR